MGGFPNYIIQEAYAVAPTLGATSSTGVIAGNSTLTSQIEVKFSADVNATNTGGTGDTKSAWSVAGNTVSSVTSIVNNFPTCNTGGAGSGTIILTLGTAISTDAVPKVTYNGTANNINIRACDGGDSMVNGTNVTPVDGLSPVFSSASTASDTTIDVVFTETVFAGNVGI